ncbi:hypothetical protein GIR22_18045 [Pseudomonas sp. CCM 7891]|uniref:Uncharacterized protein n=1 Tax=Pseudomonas karstica TaxID=1055468 RepID=A0A7X2V087_9PSED|nr:hypothetical protein [Pseudomonas karstica]
MSRRHAGLGLCVAILVACHKTEFSLPGVPLRMTATLNLVAGLMMMLYLSYKDQAWRAKRG